VDKTRLIFIYFLTFKKKAKNTRKVFFLTEKLVGCYFLFRQIEKPTFFLLKVLIQTFSSRFLLFCDFCDIFVFHTS